MAASRRIGQLWVIRDISLLRGGPLRPRQRPGSGHDKIDVKGQKQL
jgi:hypothetical protein